MRRRRFRAALVCALTIGGFLIALPASATTPTVEPGSFTALSPARVLDTRTGIGAIKAAVPAHGIVHLQIAGQGGVPPTGASAVAVNVTVVTPTSGGYLTAYPTGDPIPNASNLNFSPSQTVPNLVIAKLGTGGAIDLFNGSAGTVQLIADLTGYYHDGTMPLSPWCVTNAGAGPTLTSVSLGWKNPTNIFGYVQIVRKQGPVPPTGPSDGTPLSGVYGGATNAMDSGLLSGTQYSYSFFAFDGTGANICPTPATVTTTTTTSLPPAPVRDLSATTTNTTADLTWGVIPGDSYSGALIVRKLGTTAPTSPTDGIPVFDGEGTYHDTGLTQATTYSYTVFAHDAANPPDYAAGTSLTTATTNTASIAGTITSADGNAPLDSVDVNVYDNTGKFVTNTGSAADGTYVATGLAAGTYTLCYNPWNERGGRSTTGYVPQCLGGITWRPNPTPASGSQQVTVATGQSLSGVDAVLAPAGAITGTVTAAIGGAPLGSVTVRVFDSTGREWSTPNVVETNGVGKFAFNGLPTGSYIVCFGGEYATGGPPSTSYVDQCYNGATWNPAGSMPATATPAAVTAGSTTPGIDAVLASGGALAGTVTEAGSTGVVSNATIDVYDGTSSIIASTSTNYIGSYHITGLPPADYTVCFDATQASLGRPHPYLSQCYKSVPWTSGSPPPTGTTPVRITANQQTTADAALQVGP